MIKIGNLFKRRFNFAIILILSGLVILNIFSFYNDLLFHFLAELITIVISICLFAVLWMIREKIENNFFILIGTGFIFITILDLLHILTFEGVNILQQSKFEYSLYYYIAARFLQSITLLLAPFCVEGKIKINLMGLLYFAATSGIIYLINTEKLPALVTSSGEYSIYKTIADMIVIIFFALSLLHVYLKRNGFNKKIFRFVFLSVLLALTSHLVIAINTSETQLVSVIGLDLKILSYFLLFQTVLVTGIEKPQDVFYHSLKSNWEQLQNLIDNLNEGIGIIDLQNRFEFSNPAADQIFGLGTDVLINKNLLSFLPKDQQQAYLNIKNNVSKKNKRPYEIEIIRSDNEKRSLIVTESPQIVDDNIAGYFIIFHDITEQKIGLEKVEEARKLFQTLFMDAPIRIWEIDESEIKKEIDKLKKQGITDFNKYLNQNIDVVKKLVSRIKISRYNKMVEKFYSDGESKINSFTSLFWEESYYSYINEILAIANEKTINTFEMTTNTPSGDIRYSIVNWAVLPGHERDYSRVIISADDITNRNKTEIELKASEEKFRQLAENANFGIGHYDLTGKLLFINEKTVEYIGGQVDDYIGKDISEILGPKLGEKVRGRIQKVSRTLKTLTFEDLINLPNGEKWFNSNYSPIMSNQNKCIGVQILFNEITSQKMFKQELQSLARFPKENPNPVMRLSGFGDVIYSNQGGQQILKVWEYEKKDQIPDAINEIIKKCLKKKKPEIVEVQTGQSIHSLYFTPIPDMGYVNIYGRDITELKTAEKKLFEYSKGLEKVIAEKTDELIQAQERLLRQEKLATMGQLASSVGHELRNPLAVINNSLYMLRLNDKKQDKISKEYLDIIDQEVASANKIITDLLTFARIKPVDLNPTNLHSLIVNVLQKFAQPDNIKVSNKLAHNLPLVNIDNKQIEQVVANLITNAYQAIPINGELIIKGKKTNNQVQIDFIDNGIGIPPENLEKIFEPLFTTKAKGIGLGLTVSKMLTEINDGKIMVESTVGKGSVFSLFLPIIEQNKELEK